MKEQLFSYIDSIFNRKSYLITRYGDFPLFFTVPHGGTMKPLSIPRRTYGKTNQDAYTISMTKRLVGLFDKSPYYLMSNLHRNRVDLNRDIEEGAQGNEKAEDVWRMWNSYLKGMKGYMMDGYSKGLHIDIHSHNDSEEFHLGYNINARNYNRLFNGEIQDWGSTLSALQTNLREMMFGEYSIRKSLKARNFKVYSPNDNDVYFSGGRTIEVVADGDVASIQIECPVYWLKKDSDRVGNALYYSIQMFYDAFVERNWSDYN